MTNQNLKILVGFVLWNAACNFCWFVRDLCVALSGLFFCLVSEYTQGVALGWYVSPLWGCV